MDKWLKKVAIGATTVALGGFLVACGDDGADDNGGDAVTAASITDDPAQVEASLSSDGNWITALTADVTIDGDVTADGVFDENDYRKLALYEQDEDRNVTDTFVLSLGTLTVESPDFRIQEGELDGDVYVDADNFQLINATITGDLTFSSQEFHDNADLDSGTVQGEVSVDE